MLGGVVTDVASGSTAGARYPSGSATIVLRSSLMPSITTRTTSPTFSSPSGNGWRTAPIPAGVPVAMTSPGSSVKASERCATCW